METLEDRRDADVLGAVEADRQADRWIEERLGHDAQLAGPQISLSLSTSTACRTWVAYYLAGVCPLTERTMSNARNSRLMRFTAPGCGPAAFRDWMELE